MTDKEIELLLREDPEKGMEQIVAQYTGLLWSVADQILQEPEDIKDCVNETFTGFFYQRERFDPEKGALKNYLAVIVRRLAIKKKQENQRRAGVPVEIVEDMDSFSQMEEREALDAYLHMLDPVDEQIIRMKYYSGMTANEIAVSLGLPYETVKKRHQRSLKKLRKFMTIGMVVALLAALLAACAYVVLRYFGVVPGYGVNTDPESGIYILEESVTLECEEYDWTITEAWWNDGVLILDATFVTLGPAFDEFHRSALYNYGNIELSGLEKTVGKGSQSSWPGEHEREVKRRVIYRGGLPEGTKDTLAITVTFNGDSIPVTLRRAEGELSFEQAGYYDMTEDQGGLLAIPRLENGELIIAIYPLSEGDYKIISALNLGAWSNYGGPSSPVTVTAEDGTVLEGYPNGYNPYSGEEYFDWYFGPAEPGSYTLNVPYVYQHLAEPGEIEETQILLTEEGGPLDVEILLPGGALRLTEAVPEKHEKQPAPNPISAALEEAWSRLYYWGLQVEYVNSDPERVLVGVPIDGVFPEDMPSEVPISTGGTIGVGNVRSRAESLTDEATGQSYQHAVDYLVDSVDPELSLGLSVNTASICYRWNHPFAIEFEVSETE